MTRGFLYLATPYTGHPAGMETAFREAIDATALLTNEGLVVYSPVVHFHPVAVAHDLPRDFGFWQRLNLAMLSQARAIVVCRLDGYGQSRGVTEERRFAAAIGVPEVLMTPGRAPTIPADWIRHDL